MHTKHQTVELYYKLQGVSREQYEEHHLYETKCVWLLYEYVQYVEVYQVTGHQLHGFLVDVVEVIQETVKVLVNKDLVLLVLELLLFLQVDVVEQKVVEVVKEQQQKYHHLVQYDLVVLLSDHLLVHKMNNNRYNEYDQLEQPEPLALYKEYHVTPIENLRETNQVVLLYVEHQQVV